MILGNFLDKNTSAGLASRGNEAELNMTLCGAQSTYLWDKGLPKIRHVTLRAMPAFLPAYIFPLCQGLLLSQNPGHETLGMSG